MYVHHHPSCAHVTEPCGGWERSGVIREESISREVHRSLRSVGVAWGGGCLNMYDAPFGARAGRDDVAAVAVREAWEEREAWEVREA